MIPAWLESLLNLLAGAFILFMGYVAGRYSAIKDCKLWVAKLQKNSSNYGIATQDIKFLEAKMATMKENHKEYRQRYKRALRAIRSECDKGVHQITCENDSK